MRISYVTKMIIKVMNVKYTTNTGATNVSYATTTEKPMEIVKPATTVAGARRTADAARVA